MYQVAVFKGPNAMSSVTSSFKNSKVKGGIECRLLKVPAEPVSSAVLKNGLWSEVSSSSVTPNNGSKFIIDLDGSDQATSGLISSIKNKKTVNELVVYDYDNATGKETYAFYFSNIFVQKAFSETKYGNQKVITLYCSCISFKQKDSSNNELVLWDWNTNSHIYTGTTV
ncbi:MAG TPA: hypothetical protein QF753_15210 [Victivallales bacterium]|nr:hypothetical protein [Victivallales bacterium]